MMKDGIKYLYRQLEQQASKDELWSTENIALGTRPGTAEINVSGSHAGSSSILRMTELVKTEAKTQRVVRTESITIDTIDTMMAKHYPDGNRCFWKLDVQGYEKAVLEGGPQSLARCIGLKVELPLVPCYEGESSFFDMIPYMTSFGFALVNFQRGWSNQRTKEMYQVDAILCRPDARPTTETVTG